MFDQQLTFDGDAEDIAPTTKQDRLFTAQTTTKGQLTMEIEVGQVYRDEDGLKWRVVAFFDNGWPAVKLARDPQSSPIMTNPAWLKVWTLLD